MVSTPPEWLLLFDIDGTLLRTNGAGRESTRRAMREVYGTEGNLVSFHFGGRTDWQIVLDLLADDRSLAEADIVARLPAYHDAIARHLDEVIAEFPVEACPGGVETVQALRARPEVALGLVTGNVRSAAPVKLRAAGYDPDWFPVGAFGHEAQERAALPPLAMQRASDYFGAPFPANRVVIIGDTPADVACARAAGAWAVAVNTGFEGREALVQAEPDILLDDLTGFLNAFPA
ncbi:MAG: HAD family hydrolase, partial [Caldilineaceae bacterium]